MKTFMLAAATIALTVPTMLGAQEWIPAQERRLSAGYNDCVKAADGVMPDTIQCTQAEHGKQDARLNQAYRMVMTRLSAARRGVLRNSQRDWIRERDGTCQRRWDEAGGGQASDLEQSSCLLRQTIARTMWLERYR
ncbi:DUF1311 domain-containing protein [Sphingomonas sp. So64.6b]|uniref:lysozyme inhibitor LprI family protein n=1 Tax=Sphingomonas sp. So64.6b TaxID=2997354 RepID=UPI001603D483|nr:lysozyme inhibitor LprI family protein [Sphingomonas sp. So64.6b]QNA86401.1 DUF1311 domain-containing protein [Sphingomonas sp. So64.6b]